MRSSSLFGLAPLTVFVLSLVACGGAEQPPPPAGYVNVFWSIVDGRTTTSASFLDDDDDRCTVEEAGPCRISRCPQTERHSVPAGTLHVRADSPPIAQDIAPFTSGYADRSGAISAANGPSSGAALRVSVDGSSTVPAFATELAYPELLVLTEPAAEATKLNEPAPISDPHTFERSIRLPTSDAAVLRWTGGTPDVRFHLEGRVPTDNINTNNWSHSVVCEVPSTDGVMEIPAEILRGMTLRAVTVVERRLTVGEWSFTLRLGGEVLVRSENDAYVANVETR